MQELILRINNLVKVGMPNKEANAETETSNNRRSQNK